VRSVPVQLTIDENGKLMGVSFSAATPTSKTPPSTPPLRSSAAKQQQKRQRHIRRSAKEAIAEGFLDGSYANHLLGP